ncbi:hypothetical protein HGM15179_017548, partial [Zosterops borbonicus]
ASELTISQLPRHGQGYLPPDQELHSSTSIPPHAPFTISGCSDSASHLCVFDSRKEEIIHLSVTTTATPPELFLGLTL